MDPDMPSARPAAVADYGFLPEDVRSFIARTQAFDAPPDHRPDTAESRARYDAMCLAFHTPYPAGLIAQDVVIAGLPCRRYVPAGSLAGVPAIYFHGGGFVLGGLHSHDAICADLAQAAGVELIAVDYRLAPENPHPAAFEDACAVSAAVGGPRVLVGDSAGATLAAAVSAAQRGGGIRGQVLIYPGLGGGAEMPGLHRHPDAPLLSAADILHYRAERGARGADPTAEPLAAVRFDALPPTAIFAAECDPLVSDAALYAARLAGAGVPVTLTVEPGLVHGYLRARHSAATARASFARISAALARLAKADGPR
jgi:acetyl esterase